MDFNDPTRLPWTSTGLELVVVVCGALTLWHAVRRGELFSWACVFVYGIAMELLSYALFDNYYHARFTIMFDHQKLPLYITTVYPMLIYTCLMVTRRLGLGRAAEPLVVGLAVVLLDFPWDTLNPAAAWWRWSDADPNLRARWLGVPVANYYWHVAFGGSLAFLIRWAQPRARTLGRRALAVPLIAPATIVMGMLAFVPFHLLKRVGVADGIIVAALLGLCALTLAVARRNPPPAAARDRLLWAVPIVFHSFLLLVMITHQVERARAVAVTLAMLLTLTAHSLVHIRGQLVASR